MAWQPTHQHYKGGLYRVLGQAVHTETEERMTVYQTEDGRWWARPAAMFEETVMVDGEAMPRFRPFIKPSGG